MTTQQFTEAELAAEEWRPIPGWRDYSVSNLGRVRREYSHCFRVLKIQRNVDTGYAIIGISCSGRRKTCNVHVLFALAFHGERPAGTEVRHFPDSDRMNCRASNLSYASPTQNAADRLVHGTQSFEHPLSRMRLSDGAVSLMRWLHFEHEVSGRELASWFDIVVPGASRAINGVTWSHVPMVLSSKPAANDTTPPAAQETAC